MVDYDDIQAEITALDAMLAQLADDFESSHKAESDYIIAEEGKKALKATYFLGYRGTVKERECRAEEEWAEKNEPAWAETVRARTRAKFQRDNLAMNISATQSKLSKLSAFVPR